MNPFTSRCHMNHPPACLRSHQDEVVGGCVVGEMAAWDPKRPAYYAMTAEWHTSAEEDMLTLNSI